MASAERRPGPLEVVGRVMVEMGGSSARVEAMGDRIVVEWPNLRAGYSSMGRYSKGPGRGEAIRRIHDALEGAGLSLEVIAGGRTVGRLGVGARAGLASRMLGLGPLEILLGGVLGSFRGRGGRPERAGP